MSEFRSLDGQKRAMQNRQQHREQVSAFLEKRFSIRHWTFTLPAGSGSETYFVHGDGLECFVKLGAQVERYQIMASAGLTPPLLAVGRLEDGTSVLVQRFVNSRKPTRKDFHAYLDRVASVIHKTHHDPNLRQILPAPRSDKYRDVAMESWARIQKRWECFKPQVPSSAGFVDESLAQIAEQISLVSGEGLVVSHNDICNANWLVTPNEQLYPIDLESMSLEDPACDLGAILWWYYPPATWQRFLEFIGRAGEPGFESRMRIRMSLHCLDITLPRDNSFDVFIPTAFDAALTDFRAVLGVEENPLGYED